MGPLSVLPAYQRRGIGSQLLQETLDKARKLGYKAVIIFGNPGFYERFGFKNAQQFMIQTSSGENFDVFMALELQEGALDGISGKFTKIKSSKLKMMNSRRLKKDSHIEKHITDTQLK